MKKLLLFLPLVLILSGCSIGNYDGLTAEEWADEYSAMEEKYQSFRNCVEDYDNFDWGEKESYGGVFYYCE